MASASASEAEDGASFSQFRQRGRSRSRSRSSTWRPSRVSPSPTRRYNNYSSSDLDYEESIIDSEEEILSDQENNKEADTEDNSKAAKSQRLAKAYSGFFREDRKEVSLSLDPESIAMYFKTVLGCGDMDKKASERLRDRYYLSESQYKKLAPPDLSGTRLHVVKNLDFSALSGKLAALHGRVRDATKVQLRLQEVIVENRQELDLYPLKDMQLLADDKWHQHYELSQILDNILSDSELELSADDQFLPILKKLHDFLMKQFSASHKVACDAISVVHQLADLAWDGLQLHGQIDVAVTKTRESKYEHFLQVRICLSSSFNCCYYYCPVSAWLQERAPQQPGQRQGALRRQPAPQQRRGQDRERSQPHQCKGMDAASALPAVVQFTHRAELRLIRF